jgi:hypothetical protein
MNECRSPRTSSQRVKLVVSKHKLNEKASTRELSIIGVDPAVDAFQFNGASQPPRAPQDAVADEACLFRTGRD